MTYKKSTLFIMLAMLCIALASLACGLQTTGAVSVPLLAPKPSSIKSDTMVHNTMQVVDVVEGLNFRTCPGMDCPSFGLLMLGDVVRLTGNAETNPDGAQWVEVEFAGVTGWVNLRYLAEVK